ncbi:hypothetical protein [Roseomonas genomospecies 6]|uniref:Uncharacterized protein n=1 Tax=Roseomonas genomospecies 6 TaxID=214106 RepID=A0A9W7KRE6_9PROT|nr:hypothetical protein [Roseomonas genomospecies 6]KAA0677684.1 hypothetical protein DS843_22865 [Roseomonas genomospecies 6]
MREDLQERLFDAHPALFQDREATPLVYGVECDAGWYPILDALCSVLIARAERAGSWPARFHQLKEKFGGLRVYGDTEGDYECGAITAAERMSWHICERSGRPGKLRVRRGYYLTLADHIAAQEGFATVHQLPSHAEAERRLHGVRAELAPGPVDVPPGWRHLVEALLDGLAWEDQQKPELSDLRVLRVSAESGQLVLVVKGADQRQAGQIALAIALCDRIDPETGAPREDLEAAS